MEHVEIGLVWSGHPVGFAIEEFEGHIFVAFYDSARWLTLGHRCPEENAFRLMRLPQQVGWDSHNSISIAIDADGYLHVSANMHGNPLVYFRSAAAFSIERMLPVAQMTGFLEKRLTYPAFFKDTSGVLYFTYRQGRPGNAIQVYNRYDLLTRSWEPLFEKGLLDGQRRVSAYPCQNGVPVWGPDGSYHLAWVWRDTGDARSNHHVCYATSRDLKSWTRADGSSIDLPITRLNCDVVDPVPVQSGLINNNVAVGFDGDQNVIISYHKFSENGGTDVYNARFEGKSWTLYKTSDWDYRWDFGGTGSIEFEITIYPVVSLNGEVSQRFRHKIFGEGIWILDPVSLKPIGIRRVEPPFEGGADPRSRWPGMIARWAFCKRPSTEGRRYCLRWETLAENRDRPRPDPAPSPTMLQFYELPS